MPEEHLVQEASSLHVMCEGARSESNVFELALLPFPIP